MARLCITHYSGEHENDDSSVTQSIRADTQTAKEEQVQREVREDRGLGEVSK